MPIYPSRLSVIGVANMPNVWIRKKWLQMLEQNALEREISHGKLHGRIRLEGNAPLQAINI